MVRTPRLSLLRAQVRSLIGDLRTHKLGSTAKKKKKKNQGDFATTYRLWLP